MGRFIRRLKMGFFIFSLGSSVFLFSAFSHSPHVAMSFGEHFKLQLIENQKYLPEVLQSQLKLLIHSEQEAPPQVETKKQNSQVFISAQETSSSPQDSAEEGQIEGQNSGRPTGVVSYGGREWVMIQGQYYLYNPKNIYVVEGVTTYFKPDLYKPEGVETARANSPQTIKALGPQVAKVEPAIAKPNTLEAAKTVLHSYSPAGMQELKQNLQAIQEGMKARNEALRALEKQ